MNKIIFGDCRATMRDLIAEGVRVQMCVTSPPYYGLRDYGHADQLGLEETPEQYIANMVEVFRLTRDLLADDGVLWLNIGDSYAGSGKGSNPDGTPHPSTLLGKQGTNTGTVTGKNMPQKAHLIGLKPKDLIGIPWMLAFALRADGWYLRQDIIWHKPNPMPESVTDRCTKAHEYIFLLSKNAKYYYDNEAIKTKMECSNEHDKRARKGKKRFPTALVSGIRGGTPDKVYEFANKRSVWTVNTKPYSGAHFAVYPAELIEPCILAGSRVGDVVFDPFMGSGTSAEVAQKLGRQYLGCELNPQYEALQHKRTAQQGMAF